MHEGRRTAARALRSLKDGLHNVLQDLSLCLHYTTSIRRDRHSSTPYGLNREKDYQEASEIPTDTLDLDLDRLWLATPETFGGAQHDFMKATHFDSALKALKNAGIDLSNQGPAVHDALWSTATQFGPGSAKKGDAAYGIFSEALAGKDASSMSQSDIVAAVQDYKALNNSSLFRSSSAAVQAGTMARAANEKGSLLRLAAASSVAGVAPPSLPSMPSANMPSPVPSEIPRAPELKDPPERLSSGAGAGRGDAIRVSLPEQTGQPVGDRGWRTL